MEKRTIEQTKIYYYVFNTHGAAEEGRIGCSATSLESLKNYIDSQLLDNPERIDGWYYVFKEGPLRHLNYHGFVDAADTMFGHGFKYNWIDSNNIYSINGGVRIDY